MTHTNSFCLRCGELIEAPAIPELKELLKMAGRDKELCLGCKYDILIINNERVQEYNNNNGNTETINSTGLSRESEVRQ